MAGFPSSNFQGLTTLTLDWVILHTDRHASLIDPTYMPNFIEIEETLWTDGHWRPTLLCRLRRVNL